MTIDLHDPVLRDRIAGALLGGACGDALGVPYEFGSAPLAPGETPRMIGGGLGPYAPGEWSDDTQMAIVIARVAAQHGLGADGALDAVVQGWLEWLNGGATDVGAQTRQVLNAAAAPHDATGELWRRAYDATRALHRATGRTAGNGSLMRTAPLGIHYLTHKPGFLTIRARQISNLTHYDDLAGDACVIWSHAIRRAVLDGEVPELADLLGELSRAERRDEWAGWIAAAAAGRPSDFRPNGFVVAALQAAWSAIRNPVDAGSPLVGSLQAAVHAGEDTDTVAAIAGSLLGAAYGASAIPAEWLEVVHGWPGLRAEGLRELAFGVADRGAQDVVESSVPEFDEVADHLVGLGLGEGYEFFVKGRLVPRGLSSEYIGLEKTDDGGYRVWYSGDRGTPSTLLETAEWHLARERFVEESISLARGRNRNLRIADDPATERRWWRRR